MESSWLGHLADTQAPDEVVTVAKHFLSEWSPHELARLPREFRPPPISSSGDIGEYAFVLVRYQVLHEPDDHMLRMTAFFSAAQQRLAELMIEGQRRRAAMERDLRPR